MHELDSPIEEMGHCPTCQRDIPLRAARGPLLVTSEPWRIYWQGKAIERVPAMQVRLLYVLVRRGEATISALDMLLREDATPQALRVHILRLRRLLRVEGIPLEIENIHGWGYRLVDKEPT